MIQAIQLILALSFLVMIHELGHFTFAKIFGVRVEKFYMFFNPKISLVRLKYFDGRWHVAFFSPNTDDTHEWSKHPETTEWGIGWLPFGGYCAICGMVDETHDADQLSKDPEPWEFRAKAAWQRLLIIMGGILVNFVAAMMIFGILLFSYGSDRLPLRNVTGGLYYSEVFTAEGFQQGDHILRVNGQEPETLGDVFQWLVIEGKNDVTVLRGTDTLGLTMSSDLGTNYLAAQQAFDKVERERARQDKNYTKRSFLGMAEYLPFVIDSVLPGAGAYQAGLRQGDSIIAIAGVSTPTYYEASAELQKYPCQNVQLAVVRDTMLLEPILFLDDQARIGVFPYSKYHYYSTEHTDYSFLGSIVAGWQYGLDYLGMYVKQFRLVFTREGAQSLGGFGAIGGMFPKLWSWYAFWHMTAILSLILAFMNFLPIPALDGGYILFLLWEMITRRKPSDKFLEKANEVGFWLLLALLVFANGNDILKIFF